MARYQFLCVNKRDRSSPHTGITHLGGDGWKITRQQMVEYLNQKEHSFFTRVNGVEAEVGVNGTAPNQWVQTYADAVWTNNLLSLPECVV